MAEVAKTEEVKPASNQDAQRLDLDTRSFLIAAAKIRELENRLEDYFADVEKRLATIQVLQALKQKITQSGESLNTLQDPQLQSLLDQAREYGLDWPENGWSKIEDRDALLDAIHVQISSRESENQTAFMRINRIMSLRSETINMFSKIVNETHSEKLRILGRLHSR